MNHPRTKKLVRLLVALSFLATSHVHAALYSLSQNVNSPIPDGNPTGFSTSIFASGLEQTLTDVKVVLNVAGTYNGDLYAYLMHGNTGFAVLLNRVGKTSINPFGFGDT